MNKVQFGFSEPLNEGDTENTTLGCRHTNPDINYRVWGLN